jgi:hypothetical protein
MPARRKARGRSRSKKDQQFEKLLRRASRLLGTPQPLPLIKTPRSKHGEPL